MQTYAMPGTVRGIVLDIDNTLYDNPDYVTEQIEAQYRKAASYWGIEVAEVRARVSGWRERYARANGGRHQSLGNALAGLGIPIRMGAEWRVETIHPEEFLSDDPALRDALGRLSSCFRLIALTNNPVAVGIAALRVLGVGDLIQEVVGLDTTGSSKPSTRPFEEALRRLGTEPGETVSVGDRFDVDIEPALQLGLGGILVAGVHEVYELPSVLLESHPAPRSS